MSEKQSSYRNIMKATSLFGGVQVFMIIINIIRTKFVAILLGPSGMGIVGLLQTTILLMGGLTNFGLGTSAVKNISEAFGSGDMQRVSAVATIIRRLVWVTGIIGAVLTFILAPWLSELTFGNENYTYAFIWISVTLLFNQISTGQTVILRGLRKLQYMARASMLGSILGLITTVPLYYFYGEKGIVPGIIVTSISTLLLTWHFARKVNLESIDVSNRKTFTEGKEMLKMGFMISLSGLIGMGGSYLVRIFISNTGGLNDVGLYNAGFAIINSYVGMIFTAMSTDYYPRLAAVSNDNLKSKTIINQQAEIALLILAPVIMVFLIFINWVVILLYSTQFIEVNDLILWAALGIFFKSVSWAIAFIFLAKGASKIYFWNELITNLYLLGFNVVGYYFWGLTGLGISFLVSYILYVIQVYIISNKIYDFTFNTEFYKIFSIQLILAVICLAIVKLISAPYSYFLGLIIILISAIHSIKELDDRMDLRGILLNIKNKFK